MNSLSFIIFIYGITSFLHFILFLGELMSSDNDDAVVLSSVEYSDAHVRKRKEKIHSRRKQIVNLSFRLANRGLKNEARTLRKRARLNPLKNCKMLQSSRTEYVDYLMMRELELMRLQKEYCIVLTSSFAKEVKKVMLSINTKIDKFNEYANISSGDVYDLIMKGYDCRLTESTLIEEMQQRHKSTNESENTLVECLSPVVLNKPHKHRIEQHKPSCNQQHTNNKRIPSIQQSMAINTESSQSGRILERNTIDTVVQPVTTQAFDKPQEIVEMPNMFVVL